MSTIIRFFKPYGVLTKFTDPDGRPTLADYIDMPNVYAAGRLDKDSEGLLLLTDNPVIQTRLSNPSHQQPKTYWAQVEHIPTDDALEQLRQGVTIKNYTTRPATVRLLKMAPDVPPRQPPIRDRKHIPTAWLELTISEGKNRQVRRMTAAVGHPTLRLVRASISTITLEGLALGTWQHVTTDERESLLKALKILR